MSSAPPPSSSYSNRPTREKSLLYNLLPWILGGIALVLFVLILYKPIKYIWDSLTDSVSEVKQAGASALSKMESVVGSTVSTAQNVITDVVSVANDAQSTIRDNAQRVVDAAVPALTSIATESASVLSDITSVSQNATNTIQSSTSSVLNMRNSVTNQLNTAVNTIQSTTTTAVGTLNTALSTFQTTLNTQISTITSIVGSISSLQQSVTNSMNSSINSAQTQIATITNNATSQAGQILDSYKQLAQSTIDAASMIGNKLTSTFQALIDSIADIFGISVNRTIQRSVSESVEVMNLSPVSQEIKNILLPFLVILQSIESSCDLFGAKFIEYKKKNISQTNNYTMYFDTFVNQVKLMSDAVKLSTNALATKIDDFLTQQKGQVHNMNYYSEAFTSILSQILTPIDQTVLAQIETDIQTKFNSDQDAVQKICEDIFLSIRQFINENNELKIQWEKSISDKIHF